MHYASLRLVFSAIKHDHLTSEEFIDVLFETADKGGDSTYTDDAGNLILKVAQESEDEGRKRDNDVLAMNFARERCTRERRRLAESSTIVGNHNNNDFITTAKTILRTKLYIVSTVVPKPHPPDSFTMQYQSVLTLVLALASLGAAQGAICPDNRVPQCCATTIVDVLGVVDLECQQPPATPTSAADLQSMCVMSGRRARCCAVPVAGQSLVCADP
ncbi:hypothetical protein EJ05DRAFT_539186 [Pseudovirgaria hyperparasitica]|uniref:Hydrophobin n=1 Tax=Pseudovirgaria hyperparasitica TaxID=470096 RepID=A0A6A6W3H0_9PEZI|nr:uncharacterized protein EJ05DRAFT_539186 [Pseudovirgaria hyperparasitica]KAF2757115.1 hypothetical protein EJ05DRAFT_539186 [Pseudovirgaria hyperparasitica]